MGKYSYWLVAICLLLISCGPRVIYDQQFDVDVDGWDYADSLTYAIEVVDTTQVYDMLLSVEHSDAFSYENLYAMISTTFPDRRYTQQQVSLQLTDVADAWLGKCSGEYCAVDIPIAERRRFKAPGTYTIAIAQHSRKEQLSGIKSMRLRLQTSAE
jgi:gliding motility-associated lipoprotein GldH